MLLKHVVSSWMKIFCIYFEIENEKLFRVAVMCEQKTTLHCLANFCNNSTVKNCLKCFFSHLWDCFCNRENTKILLNLQTTKLRQRLNYYEVTIRQISLRHFQNVQRSFVEKKVNAFISYKTKINMLWLSEFLRIKSHSFETHVTTKL